MYNGKKFNEKNILQYLHRLEDNIYEVVKKDPNDLFNQGMFNLVKVVISQIRDTPEEFE